MFYESFHNKNNKIVCEFTLFYFIIDDLKYKLFYANFVCNDNKLCLFYLIKIKIYKYLIKMLNSLVLHSIIAPQYTFCQVYFSRCTNLKYLCEPI